MLLDVDLDLLLSAVRASVLVVPCYDHAFESLGVLRHCMGVYNPPNVVTAMTDVYSNAYLFQTMHHPVLTTEGRIEGEVIMVTRSTPPLDLFSI